MLVILARNSAEYTYGEVRLSGDAYLHGRWFILVRSRIKGRRALPYQANAVEHCFCGNPSFLSGTGMQLWEYELHQLQ